MTSLDPRTWRRLLARASSDAVLSSLYGPLLTTPTAPDGCFVLGRIAQSVDGRIATANGASQWISGPQDVVHTHRLRALFDAVVVGAGTARHRVFRDGPETLLFCAPDASGPNSVGHAQVLRQPRSGRGLSIGAVLAALAERGLRRVFVEGGGITVSRFLAAGALDRLHITIAPLLIGSGIPAFTLPETATLTDALRFDWSVHRIGSDLLVDIPLSRARPGVCE
jgi:diaminohydroxyphosphoribosylaminopyrimidine deaminase / 5-amino-6-(5-phosphoribosylamino)uracil reductase